MNNQKVLFFFTSEYPFGSGESFIESEISYLSECFEKIIIVSSYKNDKQTRSVPQNVVVLRNRIEIKLPDKAIALLGFFSIPVFKELRSWKNMSVSYKISNINYLLVSYFKSKKIDHIIEKLQLQLNIQKKNLYLYSYWWMDETIGIARYHRKNREVKCFTRAHGFDLYFERSVTNYLPLKRYAFENLDAVFFISEHGRNYLKKRLNLGFENKTMVSRLGTMAHQLIHLNEHDHSDEFVILTCSHIYPNKRVEVLAAALLQIKNINVRWIHYGEFIENLSEAYKKNFSDTLAVLGSSSNVKFEIRNIIPNLALMKFYSENKIDVFINISESEGLPVSIMEAMSFGIPVMATDVGGTSEIVNDNNGVLLPKDLTDTALATKIISFANMSPEQKQLKKAHAYETWNRDFNSAMNYRKFIQQISLL